MKVTITFLNKFEKKLPYGPASSFLVIYPKTLKAGTQRDFCTLVFITALFIIAKGGNNLNVHQQMNG